MSSNPSNPIALRPAGPWPGSLHASALASSPSGAPQPYPESVLTPPRADGTLPFLLLFLALAGAGLLAWRWWRLRGTSQEGLPDESLLPSRKPYAQIHDRKYLSRILQEEVAAQEPAAAPPASLPARPAAQPPAAAPDPAAVQPAQQPLPGPAPVHTERERLSPAAPPPPASPGRAPAPGSPAPQALRPGS